MSTAAASLGRGLPSRMTPAVVLVGLGLLLLVTAVIALLSGAMSLSPAQVATALLALLSQREIADPALAVVTVIRLPHLLL
ncbi:MAG: hypothetical protein L0H19_06565, partial [Salinisphaera sp.]|nr:hypothetical protein [Salinisphaera sp.]